MNGATGGVTESGARQVDAIMTHTLLPALYLLPMPAVSLTISAVAVMLCNENHAPLQHIDELFSTVPNLEFRYIFCRVEAEPGWINGFTGERYKPLI